MHVQTQTQSVAGHSWRIVVATLLALALVMVWRGQHLYAAELAAPASQGAPADQGGDDNGSDDTKVYALLESMPGSGLTDPWVIGGKAYTTTANTVFSTAEHGPFTIGGCVEVEVSSGNPTVAKQIGTESMSKCTGVPGDDNGGNGNGGDDDDIKRFGRFVSITPAGEPTRTLVISGTFANFSYSVTEATKFENEHGGLIAGVCVKVESRFGSPDVAKEVETEDDYKCSGRKNDDDDDAEGKLFGEIISLPDNVDLIGLWDVGGQPISVTVDTELDSEGVFTVGVTVKVEFVTTLDDTPVAKEIELEFGRHDDDDDDDRRFGERRGREGHAFGVISGTVPLSQTGVVLIAGLPYSVTERTKFHHGQVPNEGDLVKVDYFVTSDGSRVAHKIRLEEGQGQLEGPDKNKIVGIVGSMPPDGGLVGLWVIAGANFSATVTTKFEQEGGLTFAAGGYVEVHYVLEDGVRRILKLETHVPPGSGDDNKLGKVDSVDDNSATVAAMPTNSVVVDGVTYSITPATQVIDDSGDIVAGATVMVNSYVAAGGANVATSIRSVTLDSTLVMPYIQR